MIDTMTACRQITVYLNSFYHMGEGGIDTIDITFNKKKKRRIYRESFWKITVISVNLSMGLS